MQIELQPVISAIHQRLLLLLLLKKFRLEMAVQFLKSLKVHLKVRTR